MRIGPHRTRIAIQRDIGVASGSVGGRVQKWETAFETTARVVRSTGREFEAAQQISAELATLLVIRWRPGVDCREFQSMRVLFKHDNSTAAILYAYDPTERQRSIHIHASETH